MGSRTNEKVLEPAAKRTVVSPEPHDIFSEFHNVANFAPQPSGIENDCKFSSEIQDYKSFITICCNFGSSNTGHFQSRVESLSQVLVLKHQSVNQSEMSHYVVKP